MISPWLGETVSGVIPVHLSVDEAIYGGEAVVYLVDDEIVTLMDPFVGASTEGFCDLAHIADPRCPLIGYGGMLDTRRFPDGLHVLQVLAVRNDPNAPFYTFAQVEFEIVNQTQPPQPEVVVAEGWGGHIRIPNDGTYSYSFGERQLGTFPFVTPFLICNVGTADLDLLNHGTMVMGEGFSRVFGSPASFVEPMRCSQLNIRFDVDDPGTYYGTVSIASNDPDDSSMVVRSCRVIPCMARRNSGCATPIRSCRRLTVRTLAGVPTIIQRALQERWWVGVSSTHARYRPVREDPGCFGALEGDGRIPSAC